MNIIERYKRETDKAYKEAIELIQQTQPGINLQEQDTTVFQDSPLIQEIQASQIQDPKNYEQGQFAFFSSNNNNKKRQNKCIVCRKSEPKYTCPKCSIKYCSSEHYKTHNLFCTERFFKQQVQQQLKSIKASKEDRQKIIQQIVHNKKEADLDEGQLLNETLLEEISQQRLQQILKKIEAEEQVNLTENEQKMFGSYLRDIEFANLAKQQNQLDSNNAELNPFEEYAPFWLVEQGLKQYFLIDYVPEIQQYNNSQHKQLLNYRHLTSSILANEIKKLSQQIKFSKTSHFVNYDLIQVIYLTALMFRSYSGQSLKNEAFINSFLNIYDQNFAKKISQAYPTKIIEQLLQQLSIASIIKLNILQSQHKNVEMTQIFKSWLPLILNDTLKIFSNKYLCLQTLYRLLEVCKQNSLNYTHQSKESKKITKMIKKIEFLLVFSSQIVYAKHIKEEQGQTIAIKQIDNLSLILTSLNKDLESQKQRAKQSYKMQQTEQLYKQNKIQNLLKQL